MTAALAAIQSLVRLGFIAVLLAAVLQEREPDRNWWGVMAWCLGVTGAIVFLVIWAVSAPPAGEMPMLMP